ncbi:MAG: hypothetical protein KAI47_19030 [Deltaproteobacteria bacterium]|nr:hypothetical protein [Deltaproteobacteria bacterium]
MIATITVTAVVIAVLISFISLISLVAPVAVAQAGPRSDRQALWRNATAAVRAIALGHAARAIQLTGAARAAQALPELDALVGLAALANGKPKLAQAQLNNAIAHKSAEPQVFYWAARAELALGHRRAALRRIEEGLTIGSHRDELQAAYATLAWTLGRRRRALAALRILANRRSNLLDPALWPTPRQGAVTLLSRLLPDFPYPVALWRTQGHLYFEVGAIPPALERFSRVLRKQRNDAESLQMIARGLDALGAKKLALASAETAYTRAPGSALTQLTLGSLLLQSGEAGRAAKLLRRAADRRPHDTRLLLLTAQACAKSQQPACARRFFGYALRRDRHLAAAHFGVGLLAQAKNDLATAKLAFARAIRLRPSEPRYYEAAAHVASLGHDTQGARRFLAEARRARLPQGRANKISDRVFALLKASREALRRCDCGQVGQICKRAAKPACATAAKRVRGAAGLFLRAHLALRNKKPIDATRALTALAKKLLPKKLLIEDPKVFSFPGRTLGGVRYRVRKVFPVAIVGPLPPPMNPNSLK